MARSRLPAVASLTAVLGTGSVVLSLIELGPLSTHMALHILLMNVVAPVLAIACSAGFPMTTDRGVSLWAPTALQSGLLCAAHAPPLQHAATNWPILQGLAHGVLLLAATLFWTLLLILPTQARWRAILPLLLTGKLSCLLGA